jgi:hypothetical protein
MVASEGLGVLVLETSSPGGQAGSSSRIENYLGFPTGISGGELAARLTTRHKNLADSWDVLIPRRYVYEDHSMVFRCLRRLLLLQTWHHFSRVVCVCQYDHDIVTIGMAACDGANLIMASTNDDE